MQQDPQSSSQPAQADALALDTLNELFNAPDANPFKERDMDVLGIAGIELLQKRVQRAWPRKPSFSQIVIALPADQIASDTAAQLEAAIGRYCDAQLDQNRLLYAQSRRVSKRQLAIALIILAFDVLLLAWISTLSLSGLPALLMGVFAVLCIFAGALAIWDAIGSIVFARGPFMQDDAVFQSLRAMPVLVVRKAP